jgi:hypothetical protein
LRCRNKQGASKEEPNYPPTQRERALRFLQRAGKTVMEECDPAKNRRTVDIRQWSISKRRSEGVWRGECDIRLKAVK